MAKKSRSKGSNNERYNIYNNSEDSRGFPKEFVSSEVKQTPEYIRQYLRAMYYTRNHNSGYYNQEDQRLILNRKYAAGLQSVQKYKNVLAVQDGDTSYLNLDWSIVSVMKKFIDLRVGEMVNVDNEILCDAVDILSKTEKEDKRNEYFVQLKMQKLAEQIKETAGIDIQEHVDFKPQSEEDIDLHMEMNHKLSTEISIEELIDESMYENKWQSLQKKQACRDLITDARAGFRTYYDENFNCKFRRVDWTNVIVPFSVKEDFSDIHYFGEIMKIPIWQLRRDAKGELSEEDLWNIAKSAAGKYGNSRWQYGNSFHKYYDNNTDSFYSEYEDFLIAVLDGIFISVDVEGYEEKQNSFGGFFFEKRSFGYTPPESRNSTMHTKEFERIYEGKWVVETEYVYDYGLSKNIMRDRKNGKFAGRPLLPVTIIAPDQLDMENKSMSEALIPHEDQIQLTQLKIQQLVSKLTPPGLAIDVSALKNVILGKGGKAWTPLQIQDLYQALGTYYYNGVDNDGQPLNRRPIEEIKSSIGPALQELIGVYNQQIQMMRDVTGLNEIRDASAPDSEVGLGVQELALQSSRNTTRPIDKAFEYLHEELARRLAMMHRQNIEEGRNKSFYDNIIGKNFVKSLNIAKKFTLLEMGIKLIPAPTDIDRAMLEQNIQMALNGNPREIELEDAIVIRDIKNVKLANRYLIVKKKQRAEQRMEESMMLQQQNAQVQAQAAAEKAQADQMTAQVKAQSELAIIQEKARLESVNSEQEHQRKMKELMLEGDIKSRHIEEAAAADLKSTALTSAVKEPTVASNPGKVSVETGPNV